MHNIHPTTTLKSSLVLSSELPDVKKQNISADVQALRAQFETSATQSIGTRIELLKQLRKLVEEGEQLLKDAMWKDLHKHPTESYAFELAAVLAEIQDHIDHLSEWTKPEAAGTNVANLPGRSFIYREPLGVVCVIGTWNYPVNLLFMPLVAAISAGNCVLLRLPGEDTTVHVNNALIALLDKYMDSSYVRYVYGGVEATKEMLRERFDLIFATGSSNLGKIVARAAAETLTPVILELGGKSPVIVDSTADIELAGRRIAWGAFTNAGQTCVRPDYVLVDAKIGDRFVQELENSVRKFYDNDARKSESYGRIVNKRMFDRLTKLIENDRKFLTFGGQLDASEQYIAPTVFNFKEDVQAFTKSAVMSEEIFGPLLPVYYYNSSTNIDEPITIIKRGEKPLALYHFSTSRKIQDYVIKKTSAGGMMVNDTMMHLTNPNVPFGGVGNSGSGSYHGKFGFEAFSHKKTVMFKYSWLDLPARYAPYSPSSERVLRMVTYPFSKSQFRMLKTLSFATLLAVAAVVLKAKIRTN